MDKSQVILLMFLTVFLTSCAHVISKEVRQEAEKDVSFGDVLSDPDAYVDKTFIWGGFVAKVRHLDEGSFIEIVQNPLNKYGEIADTDVSEGRFLAFSEMFLDPLIYEKGRLVTVAGKLTGKKEVERKNGSYVYPVLTIKEIHLWRMRDPNYPDYWEYDYPPPYWWYTPWPYWPYGPPRHHRD
jgi:outer membrane lipoprotein